jgi:predicted enzyme related to lactoylglutathione lyase
VLRAELTRRCARNPSDSLRAFARTRGLGAQVIVPPQALPDGDALAILVDPEGRPFGLHRPPSKDGAR